MKAHIQPNMKHPAVKRQAWKALESHYKKVSTLHLRQLFAEDPERGERMAVEAVGLFRLISGVSNSAKYWRNASFRNSRARQSPGLTMTARRTA